jgi:hypothetical protein
VHVAPCLTLAGGAIPCIRFRRVTSRYHVYAKTRIPDNEVAADNDLLAEGVLELNGCSTEGALILCSDGILIAGIFRVPGDHDAVTELRVRIEQGKYDLSGISDASVPGSLLKFWYVSFGGGT